MIKYPCFPRNLVSGKEQVKRMRLLNISTNPRFAEIWGVSAKQKPCGRIAQLANGMGLSNTFSNAW